MRRWTLSLASFALACSTNGGSASSHGSAEEGTGDGDGDGDGDASAEGSAEGDGDGDGDGDSNDGGNTKWDTVEIPDAAMNCGGSGGGDPEFSYLWAANSSEGSISKIDTMTVEEMGRYRVRPDSAGSPSRTSVSLSGHVAVANRMGGLAKVYATSESCEESNGQPGLQTSVGNQSLAWGTEECLAWYTPMNFVSQRPAAWAPGVFNDGTCQWENEIVWTSGSAGGTIDVLKVNGDDGSVEETVNLGNAVQFDGFGIYGGASDGEGHFWGTQLGGGTMVRVDYDDMTFQTWQVPVGSYGMTVDDEGYVWACGGETGRFDPETETWATAQVGGGAGCMADAGEDGLLWLANGSGIVGVNRQDLTVEKTCANTNGSYGISVDWEGYVWAVAYGNNATRVDTETCELTTYSGLVGAYTYSDMTGFALGNAGSPNN